MNKAQQLETIATVVVKAWSIGIKSGLTNEEIIFGIVETLTLVGYSEKDAEYMANVPAIVASC